MATKIRRSQFKTFLNTGTYGTPTWVVIGDGVVSAAIQYNPKVTEEIYIVNETASITVDSYAPKMPVESSAKQGDPAFDWFDTLMKARGVLGSAEGEVVNVWLYDLTADGFYYAERQAASFQIDEFGGEGGVAAKMKYVVNFLGVPEMGIFNPTTVTFDGVPVATILTTMTVGAITLTPLFSANHANQLYTGSIAAATAAMNSTLAGATIVQKCNGTVVNQGSNASLNMGLNHLTIDVTVGGETATYHIDITRTA